MPAESHATPVFKVVVDGTAIQQAAADGMVAMTVERHVEMIGMAQLTFEASASVFSALGMGKVVEVQVGGSSAIFTGLISELRFNTTNNKSTLTVVAMDKLVKLVASTRTKVFENQKDSDIASSVCGGAGLSVATDATSETNKYVLQRSESDYFFLKRLAARNHYYVFADGTGKVQFKKADFANGTEHEIKNGEVESYDFGWSTVQMPSSVKVYGWDYVKKETVTGEAQAGDVPVVGGGTNLLSDRGDLYGTNKTIVDVLVASASAAKSMATSEYGRLGLNGVRGTVVIQGKGDIEPGHRVKFTGFETGGNAKGVVIAVKHTQDAGGFKTTVFFAGNAKPT
jgi:phage protein D